jgi:hypothetical protein
MNLAEALAQEIKRSQELLVEYKKLPNGAGFFGAWMIQASIDNAVNALASGDVVAIAQAYAAMKDNE